MTEIGKTEKRDNKVSIIVETVDGEHVDLSVNTENKVASVIERVAERLNVNLAQGSYELWLKSLKLDPESKIEAYNIKDGDTLVLRKRPHVGLVWTR